MAPEVMDGEVYTTAADVYSFGIILWELWTGKIPFEGLQPIQVMFKVYAEGLRPPIEPEDCFHPKLEDLIVRCWSEVASSRPTFEEILDELENDELRRKFESGYGDTSCSVVPELGNPLKLCKTDLLFLLNIEEMIGLCRNQSRGSLDVPGDLMSAISRGSLARVQELIKANANVNFMDYDKRTPLHLASAEKNAEMVNLLIESGADVNAKDRWGSTPLNDAYLSDCAEAVEL